MLNISKDEEQLHFYIKQRNAVNQENTATTDIYAVALGASTTYTHRAVITM